MLKVALSHDVDRIYKSYQYITHILRSIKQLNIKKLFCYLSSIFMKNPYWNFNKIIKIETEYDVKSTFFFLSESIKFNPFKLDNWKLSLGRYSLHEKKIINIIKWLDKNGWEIGVHGSYNSYNDKKLLLKEKKTLEDIVGHEIVGVRQHYLNLDDKTWLIQKKCGFKYDSSFGYIDSIGFKDNKIVPFRPFGDNFIVFPLTIMDSCFMNTANRWERLREIVDIAQGNDALLVINWHQRNFNENEFSGYLKNYIKIIEECKERNAQFYTLREYYNKNAT